MFVSSNCHANYIIYDLNLFLAWNFMLS
jgi:hypothetical protein